MQLALIQHDIVWEDPQANFDRLEPKIAQAAQDGAELVLLSEMFSCGFSMDTAKIAEPPDGPSTQFLLSMAAQHNVCVGGSLPLLGSAGDQASGDRPHNTLTLAMPDQTLHRYAKIHPFSYGQEDDHYRAGTQLATARVGGVSLGLSVCYDLRFAYLYWHLAKQADLLVVVANWPAKRRHHWRSLLVARAIENQVWVAGVNRVGSGGGIDYCGDSLVVNPLGEIVADGEVDRGSDMVARVTVALKPTITASSEMTLLAEIDPGLVAQTRERFPFMRDRLADFGAGLSERPPNLSEQTPS